LEKLLITRTFLGGNMYKSVLKTWIAPFLGVGALLSTHAFAQNAPLQTPPSTPVGLNDECSKELLISYFPKVFVLETLKKYNVPQDKWEAIASELAQKDKQVIKTVEEKAAKLDPNPLKDPQQRQAAVRLFRETLTDLFALTMKAHGIKDGKQITDMLNDIQQQKAKRFAMCMQKVSSEDSKGESKAENSATLGEKN
jgi:hypothetical protein